MFAGNPAIFRVDMKLNQVQGATKGVRRLRPGGTDGDVRVTSTSGTMGPSADDGCSAPGVRRSARPASSPRSRVGMSKSLKQDIRSLAAGPPRDLALLDGAWAIGRLIRIENCLLLATCTLIGGILVHGSR